MVTQLLRRGARISWSGFVAVRVFGGAPGQAPGRAPGLTPDRAADREGERAPDRASDRAPRKGSGRRRVACVAALAAVLATACIDLTLAQDTTTLAASSASGAVTLGAGSTRVPLTAVREARDISPGASLAARLRAAVSSQQVYLHAQRMTTTDAPGVTYNVYLNLAGDRPVQGVEDPHYLGTLNFFNAERRPGDVVLNVTEPVRRLLVRGEIGEELTVTIAPAGEPNPAARPQIGRLLITAR